MTVETEQSAIIFTGIVDGVDCDVPFPVQADTELVVRYGAADTIATLNIDYSVTLDAPDYETAKVTPLTGFAALSEGTISVRREVPYTQPTDIPTLVSLATARVEQMFDRIVFICQQLRDAFVYSLKFPSTDQAANIGDLPVAADRANKYLAFGPTGKPVAVATNVTGSTIASAFGAAWAVLLDAAAGRLALGVPFNVDTYNALVSLTIRPDIVYTRGYYTAGDGGAGEMFDWFPGDTTTVVPGFIVSPSVGTAGRYKRRVTGPINILSGGAKRDLSFNSSSAIQGTVDFAGSRQLFAPLGQYRLNSKITSLFPINLRGEGHGGGPGAVLNSNCTQFIAYFNNDNVFEVTSPYASTFENFQVASAGSVRPCTAGAAIKLIGAGAGGTVANSVIRQIATSSMFRGIDLLAPSVVHVYNTYHESWVDAAINVATTAGVEGSAGFIHHNYCFGAVGSICSIRLGCGYSLVTENWMLSGVYGLLIAIENGPAGSARALSNIIENQATAGIAVETVDGSTLGMLELSFNELSVVANTGAFTASIFVDDNGGTGYIDNMRVCGNFTRNNLSLAGSKHIWIGNGRNAIVSGNVCDELGAASPTGIQITGDSSNAGIIAPFAVEDNTFLGTFNPRHSIITAVRLRYMHGLTVAQLPGTCADGSMAFATDGLIGSAPLTGASTGCLAVRRAASWDGI